MGKKLREAFGIGFAATAAAILLGFTGLFESWENAAWDWRARWLARPGPHTEKVKLILIDQESLDWAERENGLVWPWPREMYVPILDFCRRAGARSVAFVRAAAP